MRAVSNVSNKTTQEQKQARLKIQLLFFEKTASTKKTVMNSHCQLYSSISY